MSFVRPTLETRTPCVKEQLYSFLGAICCTGILLGGLAFLTVRITTEFDLSGPAEPIAIETENEENESVEEEADEPVEPEVSQATPVAPTQPIQPIAIPRETTDPLEIPEVENPPDFDAMVWTEISTESWEAEKPKEVKVQSKPRVARKSTPPARKSVVSPPKPANVKPTLARVSSRSTPIYPSRARRSRLEGRVVITVTISTTGHVSSARVTQSSSHSSLDSAALSAAKRYRFVPARNSRGQAVSTQVALPFSFKLT